MATLQILHSLPYVDESDFERVDGQLIPRNRISGDIHSETQDRVKTLLMKTFAGQISIKALSEWSITRPEHANETEPDYMTPDVLVARVPYQRTRTGHLIRPAVLAVEIVSPGQGSLIAKAQQYVSWGVEHVWIIDPYAKEAYEHHGGNTVIIATDTLRAGELQLAVEDLWKI